MSSRGRAPCRSRTSFANVVSDGSRIEVAGKGAALEPRYEPADDPANRARNRRVEIIHRRGG